MSLYRARQSDCSACALKDRCCPGQPHRKVPRSVHEAARDAARRLAGTPEYIRSRRERKKVEMLFAHLKRILRLNRLRLRGPLGAKDEFLLAAIARTFASLPSWPEDQRSRRPRKPRMREAGHGGRSRRRRTIGPRADQPLRRAKPG